MDEKSLKEKALSPVRRESSISKNLTALRSRTKTAKLPQKGKVFIEEILKKNMEKTIKIFKSSVPSYFNRHFRQVKQEVHLSSSETSNRFSSPVQSLESKPKSITEKVPYPLNPLISFLHLSNGIDLYRVMDPNYKYFIGPGNNDALIHKLLKTKPGWVRAFSPHSANLIWTDVKKSAVFDLIPKIGVQKKTPTHMEISENPILGKEEFTALVTTATLNPLKVKIYNKLEGNSELASKKKLFYNMNNYYKSIGQDPFCFIPLTFHFVNGTKDASFQKFIAKFNEIEALMSQDPHLNNCWVIKPGEATNRGTGITVCSKLSEISSCVDEKKITQGVPRTYIVQKYLYKPLLYNNRKFDIRCYALITIINNNIQGYFYKEGYLRTSCSDFNIENIEDKFIHLTNDAIQKKSPNYGKYEDGNKLSYDTFQKYIDENLENKVNFKSEVYPKMRNIVKDTMKATYKSLDPCNRAHCFEVLGYDFMIDQMFNPWLIEVNTNPCLSLSGKYLSTLIPNMLNHSFAITIDQLFPSATSSFENNRYELVFSQINKIL